MGLFGKSIIKMSLLSMAACRPLGMSDAVGGTESSPTILIAESTVIPSELKSLDANTTVVTPNTLSVLRVPPGMLAISEVVRPRAYLRQGPGTHFEVGDQPVTKGTGLIILAEVGVWKKVQLIPEAHVGWIHHRALSEPHPNKTPVRVDAKNLPTVSTLRSLTFIESFPKHERIPMSVPKGSVFSFLRSNHEGYLVWLPVTNSVLWLRRKDAL